MKYFYLALLLLLVKSASAQTLKYYVTWDGHLTDEKLKATSYIYVQQMSDSAYKVTQYDMGDTLLSYSYYKDAGLKIPAGKFVFYKKTHFYNPATKTDSAGTFVQQTGYYLDGKRSGVWLTYSAKNVKASEYEYDDDKENGPFTTYRSTDNSFTTGIMKDGAVVGSAYTYSADSVLVDEIRYKDGRVLDEISHITLPVFKNDFYNYMEKQMKPYKDQLKYKVQVVNFTVTVEGKVIDAVMVKGVNPAADDALLAALKNAPLITPAMQNGKPKQLRTGRGILLYANRSINYANSGVMGSGSSWQVPHQRVQTKTYTTSDQRSDGSTLIMVRDNH
jgi:antitoxin component YwqK of YwqJK toxin-antitoxin module